MTREILILLDQLQAELATFIEDYAALRCKLEVAEREKIAMRRDLEAFVESAMVADRVGTTESGKEISPGTHCRYVGHIVGGMVRVRLPDGSDEVVDPRIFKELR